MERAEDSVLFPTHAKYPITLIKGNGSRLRDDRGMRFQAAAG